MIIRKTDMDYIKIDLEEVVWIGGAWIGLTQDRGNWRALVNAVIYLQAPLNAESFFSGCTNAGSLSCAELHTDRYFIRQFFS
jgi:hypothetical protein